MARISAKMPMIAKITEAENGDITDAFLERHPDFAPVGEPVLQWPGQGSDGFYYACMERT